MTAKIILFAVLVAVVAFKTSVAQTGVCYRLTYGSQAYTAYRQTYYYQRYSCGWWGWRSCYRRRYGSQAYTAYMTTYGSAFGCCSGYSQSGSTCNPVCSNCGSGYNCVSPGNCQDINECNSNNGGCSDGCVNTGGSYYCTCPSGYGLASNQRSCQDINECTTGAHNCAQNCHNTAGSYSCSCNTGYTLNANGRSCNDINECTTNSDNCDTNEGICTNTVGSFTCSCITGFELHDNGYDCNDINECTDGLHGCEHHCDNNHGSYTCYCNSGYVLDSNQRNCNDVNECTAGTDACDHNCQNTIGSFTCSCDTGYELFDQFYCRDIDECTDSDGIAPCNQLCTNTIGSFYCSCHTGFELDTNQYTCIDIDECARDTDGCAQNCHNNIGSYTCSCNTGYRLAPDQHGCLDIDECAEDIHGCEQICTNTIGSYFCSCTSGYELNSDQRNCDDIDECMRGTDECEQNCANTIGSYTCSCNGAYVLTSNAQSCLGPPQDVVLAPGTSRQLQLTWTLENDPRDGTAQYYTVNCTSYESDPSYAFFEQTTTADLNYQYSVNDLTPFSTYECCIAVSTDLALSVAECASGDTLQDIPLDPPTNVMLYNTSAYYLDLEWGPPTTPYGIIITYTIYVDYTNGSFDVFTTSGTVQNFTIINLRPHQLIGVTVTSSTHVGEGPASTRVETRTHQDVPSQVTNVGVVALNNNEFLVSWGLPVDENGILVYFDVNIYHNLTDYNITERVGPDVFQINLPGLFPYLPYHIQVSGATQAGEGDFVFTTVYTREGAPIAPIISDTFRTNARTIVIFWDPQTLDETRGFLTEYDISFIGGVGFDCEEMRSELRANTNPQSRLQLSENTYSVTLNGLHPGWGYCVGVAGITAGGLGPFAIEKVEIFRYTDFQLFLDGVSDCDIWVTESKQQKISDITDTLVAYIEGNCGCDTFNEDYITNHELYCTEDNPDQVVFQAVVVTTMEKESSDFQTTEIAAFSTSGREVAAGGIPLTVNSDCPVNLYTADRPECNIGPNATPPPTSGPSTFSPGSTRTPSKLPQQATDAPGQTVNLTYELIGGVFGGFILLAIVIVVVALVSCYVLKDRAQRTHVKTGDIQPQIFSNDFSSDTRDPFLTHHQNVGTLPRPGQMHVDDTNRTGTGKRPKRASNTYVTGGNIQDDPSYAQEVNPLYMGTDDLAQFEDEKQLLQD